MSRPLGFIVGFVLIAAPAGAWLVHTGRLPFTLPTITQAEPETPAPSPGSPPAASAQPESGIDDAPAPEAPKPERAEPTEGPPSSADLVDAETAPADSESPPPPDPEPAPTSPAGTDDGPALAEAVVWQPFRSQRAASGFADHLAERYGVATSVRRDGPGRYRVLVVADGPANLESELQRLRAETGLARLEERP